MNIWIVTIGEPTLLDSKNPRLLRHKLVPSKLNGNRTIAQKHVVDSTNSPEENGNILLKNKVQKLSNKGIPKLLRYMNNSASKLRTSSII